MSISTATTSASSIHTGALTTHTHCNKCNYIHPPNKCPTYGQQCYACGGSNYCTAFCKQDTGDPGTHTILHNEVNTSPGKVPASTEADVQAGLPAANHTTNTTNAVAPPAVHSIVQAIAHCPAIPTDPIASKHPIGTSRTLLTSYSLTVL